jgi:hypothetical protein
VFSPAELLELLRHATELGLIGLQLIAFTPTAPGGFEFYATFERLADNLPAEERRARCLAALGAAVDTAPGPEGISTRVSARELQRWALTRVRKTVRSIRRG